MSNSVYDVNKAINRPIEFKGLKAQYIWYLLGGLLSLFLLYAVLYMIGIGAIFCLPILGGAGTFIVIKVYGLSNKYGEYGLMKVMAKKSIPKVVRCNSRRGFIRMKT